MKVLVVSLAGLREIILATSLLRTLKKSHPYAQVHFLMHHLNKGIVPLIPYVDQFHILEKDEKSDAVVEKLRQEKFDRIINLTPNPLGAWFAAALECSYTQGFVLTSEGRRAAGSEWFEQLTPEFDPGPQRHFHVVDIYHYGTEFPHNDRALELLNTPRSDEFALRYKPKFNKKKVVFFPSQDSRWTVASQLLNQVQPDTQSFFLETTDLEEIVGALSSASLLVTTDPVAKHIAAALRIKVLELAFDKKNDRKFSPYGSGPVILEQRTSQCDPELVALAAGAVLRGDTQALRILAHEYEEQVAILKTGINNQGDWVAYEIGPDFSHVEIGKWIERTSSKLFLEKEHEKPVGQFGSEGVELRNLLKDIFPDQSWREWSSELKSMESQISWLENQISVYLSGLKEVLKQLESEKALSNFISKLRAFCEELDKNSYLRNYGLKIEPYLDTNESHPPFVTVKRLRELLGSAYKKTKIELKLIRSLQTEFMEVL